MPSAALLTDPLPAEELLPVSSSLDRRLPVADQIYQALRDAIVTAQAEADVMRSLGGSDSKAYQRCLHQRKAAMAAEGVTLQYYFLPGKGPRPDPTRWERFADVVEPSWSVLLAVPLIGATLAVWWISPDRAVTGAEGAGFAAAAKSGSGLSDMLAATCYLVGGVIGLMALFKFKQHDQVPQLPRLSEPIVMALVSGALLTAPALPHPERYRHVPACPPPATADVPIDKAALPAGP